MGFWFLHVLTIKYQVFFQVFLECPQKINAINHQENHGVLRRLTHQQWLAGRGGVGVGEGVQGNVHLRPPIRPWETGSHRGWKTSFHGKTHAIFKFYVNLPEGLYIYIHMYVCDYICVFMILNGFTTLEMIWYDHRWAISRTHFFFHMGSRRISWGIAIIFYHRPILKIILYWDDLGCRIWRWVWTWKCWLNPIVPSLVLLIIIPMNNGYFIGNINPTFSDKPRSLDIVGFPKFCLVVDVQVLIGGGSQSHQL